MATKKPRYKEFEAVASECRGNITKIAKVFRVYRCTVYEWMSKDEKFKGVVDHFKGELLDECVQLGRIVALGIPDKDESGKMIGWKERPDPSMLRYFMSTLGRNEGYGDDPPPKDNADAVQNFEAPMIVFEK